MYIKQFFIAWKFLDTFIFFKQKYNNKKHKTKCFCKFFKKVAIF